jgi:hypothetical protein
MIFAMFLGALALTAHQPRDTVVGRGVVSTAAAEVRLAIRPDRRQILWGSIGRGAAPDQEDIWEQHMEGDVWSAPAPVGFNTPAAEFDPAFSPDGRRLYFHSDRPGGLGGTDLYAVDVEAGGSSFGAPVNLGSGINSPGDEWAPTPDLDGRLIFSSDGWGGYGLHDLFEVSLADPGGRPVNLGAGVNGPDEDFDAALTVGGRCPPVREPALRLDVAEAGTAAGRLFRLRPGRLPRRGRSDGPVLRGELRRRRGTHGHPADYASLRRHIDQRALRRWRSR